LRSVAVIATTTIVFGLLLGLADRRHGSIVTLSWAHALLIGASQVLALIPGTSRSGITMTAALLLGLSRTTAARASFLLSIPTIAGAALLLGVDVGGEGLAGTSLAALGTGFVVAGVSAYLCIDAFIRLVERTGMLPYVLYRLLLGSVLFALIGFGLVPA
jgi:undecaprenyl-diphosphatase